MADRGTQNNRIEIEDPREQERVTYAMFVTLYGVGPVLWQLQCPV